MKVPRQAATDEAWAELPGTLARSYGVRVRGLVKMRTVIGVSLQDGRKWIWKWARPVDTEQRLRDVAAAVSVLGAGGVPAAGPIINGDGRYLTLAAGRPGYVQPWLPGRHVNGANMQEQLGALAVVGYCHTLLRPAAASFRVVPDAWPLRRKLGAKRALLRASLPRALAALPALRDTSVDWLQSAEDAWQALVGGDAPSWRTYRARRTFCHRDMALHNLLWQGPGRIALIDFDQAAPDDPLGDVFQLVHHFSYMRSPEPGSIRAWVEAYRVAARLVEEDERRLWGLLSFPDLLTRAVGDWVRAGCPASGAARVLAACRSEEAKLKVLRSDARSRWGGG
jgi:Ser/Thr protein kinase RdoA (MazF antagonist)